MRHLRTKLGVLLLFLTIKEVDLLWHYLIINGVRGQLGLDDHNNNSKHSKYQRVVRQSLSSFKLSRCLQAVLQKLGRMICLRLHDVGRNSDFWAINSEECRRLKFMMCRSCKGFYRLTEKFLLDWNEREDTCQSTPVTESVTNIRILLWWEGEWRLLILIFRFSGVADNDFAGHIGVLRWGGSI